MSLTSICNLLHNGVKMDNTTDKSPADKSPAEKSPIDSQRLKQLQAIEQLTVAFADKLQTEFLTIAMNQLMDMADRAKTNDQQWQLMQLAKEIKKQQPQLADSFKNVIKDGFQQFRAGTLGGKVNEADDLSSGLSLIAHDELEQNLAATSLARKVEMRSSETLYSLNHRLAVINNGKKLSEDGNPVGCFQFATALQSIITELKLDTRLTILFFRIFEKILLERMPDFYEALNGFMIKQGILPNLRYGKIEGSSRASSASAPGTAAKAETAAKTEAAANPSEAKATSQEQAVAGQNALDQSAQSPAVTQQQMYEAIQKLQQAQATLEQNTAGAPSQNNAGAPSQSVTPLRSVPSPNARIQTNGYQPGFYSQPAFAFDNNAAVAVCQPQEVIAAVVNIATAQHVGEIEQSIVRPMTVEQYQAVTMQVRQDLGENKRIGDEEGKVIDIVGMIFEFMLADKQLPDPVKAVLSYLHTPYLKMALIEGDLLKNPEHPSRKLLDSLAEAGTKWVSSDGQSQFKAFPKIKSVVRRIITEFTTDPGLFSELLAEMREYNQKVENNVALVERRSREKAEGEERLREVKQHVLKEIRSRMEGHDLPSPVIVLLLHPWADYLTFTLLRHSEESSQWHEALDTVSDIIWSIQPKNDINDRNRLMLLQETLQTRVQEGLETIAYDQSKSHKLVDALHKSQMLALQNLIAEPAAPEKRAEMESDAMKETGAPEPTDASDISNAEAELVEKLRTVEFGTWMEFDVLDNLHNQRVKIAWFNARTSRYMLVDRSGKQIATKTGAEIARMMLASQARMIAGSAKPFFERALENIFARLKSAMAR